MKKKVLLVCPGLCIVAFGVIVATMVVSIITHALMMAALFALILILFPTIFGIAYGREFVNSKGEKVKESIGTRIFDIVILDEEGIRNSKRKIPWDKVFLAKAKTYEFYGWRKVDRAWQQAVHTYKDIELACFYAGREVNGKVYADADTEIVLHMNKKTRKLLLQYAEGKSQVVDKFLNSAVDWYKYME